MNLEVIIRYKKIYILFLFFVLSLAIRLSTLNQIGRTWDEEVYVSQGYEFIKIFEKKDFNNKYFYITYDHPPLVKYLYGITAIFDKESVGKDNVIFNYDYTFSRILSAILFSIGLFFVILTSWKIFNFKIGILSGSIYLLLPFTIGLSQLVTTESLKLFIYPITIYSYLFLLDKFSKKTIIISGILTGIALQVKQTDALLFLILAITMFLHYKKLHSKEKALYFKKYIQTFILIILISCLVFFAIWPQAIIHMPELMQINEKLWSVKFSSNPLIFTLSPPEVFMGSLRITPIFYYAVYFFISIPIVVIFLFFLGLKKIFNNINCQKWLIILWFIVPFLLSFYSWRQHGLRYIVEIYPAIAIISAVGLNLILEKIKHVQKLIILFFFTIYLFLNLIYVSPYYLDYFNELVGGVDTVYKYNLFQIGWWGQGQREAGMYLLKNAPTNSRIGLAVSPETTFPIDKKFNYYEYRDELKYDYVVVNHYHIIRDGFSDKKIKEKYKLVYEVKVSKAVLVYVYKAK